MLERTPLRNSPLFATQLSDRPGGTAVHGRHPLTVYAPVSGELLCHRCEQLQALIISSVKNSRPRCVSVCVSAAVCVTPWSQCPVSKGVRSTGDGGVWFL